MHRANGPVSLADLSAAGVRLRPHEAATIVRELVLQVARGEVAGVPSSQVIRLSGSGTVSIEGPVGADGPSVKRAAQLLDSLLPSMDVNAASHSRVPGGLRLVVARAIGSLDLPPFDSLEAFAEALSRFAATDPAATVSSLVVTCVDTVVAQQPVAPPSPDVKASVALARVEPFVATRPGDAHVVRNELTVSDIRRARRATGLTLTQVARRSRIPLALLRQLEWGYLLNWPPGHYGRTQLIRYARAAGLDEQLVLSTITPLVLEAESRRRALVRHAVPAPPVVDEPIVDEPVVEVEVLQVPQIFEAQPRTGRSGIAVVAAAIIALVSLALVPSFRSGRDGERLPAVVTSQPGTPTRGAAASNVPAASAPVPSAAIPPVPTGTSSAVHNTPVPVETAGRQQPQTERSSAPLDESEPAYRLAADGVADSRLFGSAGTAMFHNPSDGEGSSLGRPATDGSGSVLRVTKIVDDTANSSHVRPSPDGKRIAFDSDRDGERGVYVADSDGKHVRRVSPEGYSALPSWSPDGQTIAFVRAEPTNDRVWNLWTLELASGQLRQVTQRQYGAPWGGSWFPDGRRIAYSHEDRLIIHDLDTGTERIFKSPRRGRQVRMPAVSPDGKRIIFQVRHDGTWLLELGEDSMRRILDDATAEEYTWSPEGRRVAYHSQKAGGWGVWMMAKR